LEKRERLSLRGKGKQDCKRKTEADGRRDPTKKKNISTDLWRENRFGGLAGCAERCRGLVQEKGRGGSRVRSRLVVK